MQKMRFYKVEGNGPLSPGLGSWSLLRAFRLRAGKRLKIRHRSTVSYSPNYHHRSEKSMVYRIDSATLNAPYSGTEYCDLPPSY
jgi:hypothetical protein